ncbi:MAG: hypothetical protein IJT01_13800, partial [Selenomonadaceae bacterium]|nr:hypothetical protein [Selenomonadaceae bacterium]
PSWRILNVLPALTNPRHSTTMTAVCRLGMDIQSTPIWATSFNQRFPKKGFDNQKKDGGLDEAGSAILHQTGGNHEQH